MLLGASLISILQYFEAKLRLDPDQELLLFSVAPQPNQETIGITCDSNSAIVVSLDETALTGKNNRAVIYAPLSITNAQISITENETML